jgi:hypothetical protein
METRAWSLHNIGIYLAKDLTAKEMLAGPAEFAQIISGIALNSSFKSASR